MSFLPEQCEIIRIHSNESESPYCIESLFRQNSGFYFIKLAFV